jgi:mRNA interferase MazF
VKPRKATRFLRGDVVWLNCDPSVGSELRKVRTCIVVSNNSANQYGQAITVVPTQGFTEERAARAYMVDLRAPRSNLKEARVANASMVMTYDRSRIASIAGRISKDTLARVDNALRVHLDLEIV